MLEVPEVSSDDELLNSSAVPIYTHWPHDKFLLVLLVPGRFSYDRLASPVPCGFPRISLQKLVGHVDMKQRRSDVICISKCAIRLKRTFST